MGGITGALFGSSGSTQQYDNLRPEWSYQKSARQQITPALSSSFTLGNTTANNAVTNLGNLANSYNVDNATEKQATLLSNNTQQNIGTALNGLAQNGIINSSEATKTLSDIGTNANNQLLGNYNNNVDRAASLNQMANSAGLSAQEPYTNLYKSWLSAQVGSPLQTVSEGGSSGLLGAAASGILSGLGSKYGTNLATKWGG